MQQDSSEAVAVDLDHFWQTADYGHASAIASDPTALVLERLPNGEYAWLRPEVDARYVLTDQGRRELAEAESK